MTSYWSKSEVKTSKAVIDQPYSKTTKTPTQTKARSSSPIKVLPPTHNQPSHDHQNRNAPPTQITVQIPDDPPSQISVLDCQTVTPHQKPLETENKAPYPTSNLPCPIDSPHKIPIAGQF